jgi:hypothetical protein
MHSLDGFAEVWRSLAFALRLMHSLDGFAVVWRLLACALSHFAVGKIETCNAL